jgi:hypothetical protein
MLLKTSKFTRSIGTVVYVAVLFKVESSTVHTASVSASLVVSSSGNAQQAACEGNQLHKRYDENAADVVPLVPEGMRHNTAYHRSISAPLG